MLWRLLGTNNRPMMRLLYEDLIGMPRDAKHRPPSPRRQRTPPSRRRSPKSLSIEEFRSSPLPHYG
jgi:hypothetical protein